MLPACSAQLSIIESKNDLETGVIPSRFSSHELRRSVRGNDRVDELQGRFDGGGRHLRNVQNARSHFAQLTREIRC